MESFLKYYLPVFLLVYLAVTFILPSLRVYKQTSINPVTFGRRDDAHDYIGFIMKIITGLLIAAILLFSLNDRAYQLLAPFHYLHQVWIKYTGLFFLHTSLTWIMIAQYQMKQSWRIGLDEKNKTELITGGLFRLSRNPVFLGMIVSTTGMFLVIPNAITFFTVTASYIVIQIQIRLEEEHLQKLHGAAYSDYKQKVRRLL